MPVRPLTREQAWLLPPSLDDLLSADHPVHFVATFVDELDAAAWSGLGMRLSGEELGAPAYNPRLLLSVWLYGFMTGIRSSRKLEAACREQLPFLWLTAMQTPDHNTLWRFYQEHRRGMRNLLKRTVSTAVAAGLVDLALQAVDGSKVGGNAARERTYDAEGLRRLLTRTEAAIADLEAQNETSGAETPARLPQELRRQENLRDKVKAALRQVAEDGRINLTDADAVLLKGRHGYIAGYNAQAVVSPVKTETGEDKRFLITAAEVSQQPDDHDELLRMLEAAEENLGQQVESTLADAGYHSGENLSACEERGQTVVMPEAQARALANPYHKDAFTYDAASDTFTCPQGQTLHYTDSKRDRKGRPVRRYRAAAAVCRACPAFGICTKDRRHGRALEVGPDEPALRRQRALMATAAAGTLYKRRKELIEPAFGIIKEQLRGRNFLLRGLDNVLAEWSLLAIAFNLRLLAGIRQLVFSPTAAA
jgi:transposase